MSQEKRVSDIMSAARQVIAEKGYENTPMSEIADRAGVVEGTLYRYFENKQDLLTRVAEDWFAEVLDADKELPAIRGTKNRLQHLIWRALMTVRQQPALSRYVLLEMRQHPDFRSTRSFEINRRMTAEISDLCKRAQESGEFRKDVSVALVRDMIFGGIEHRTWRFLRGEGDFSVDEVADGIATVIYRGMAGEAALRSEEGLETAIRRLEAIASTLRNKIDRTPD